MAVQGKGKRFGGRSKGTPNAITTQVRDMVMRAIEFKGGVEYFIWAADNEPKAFLALAGKCIPQAIEGRIEIEHKFSIRDFTALGDPNGKEEDENRSEIIDIGQVRGGEAESEAGSEVAGSGGTDQAELEDGVREGRLIPIEAIDRGSIPVPVSVEPRGRARSETVRD